jgi:ERF superfamily protein
MGAALTYARRYALFTLVGIAGEDDLDAADLGGHAQATDIGQVTPVDTAFPSPPGKRRGQGNGKDGLRSPLGPDASAALRDELVGEVASLRSAAEAARWARTALPAKNTLTASGARLVELAFELRLSATGSASAGDELGGARYGVFGKCFPGTARSRIGSLRAPQG